jgi:hypothetical protein
MAQSLRNSYLVRPYLRGVPVGSANEVGHAEELLKPITLGCKTKVAKIVGISVAALQRLVSIGGVPTVSPPCRDS